MPEIFPAWSLDPQLRRDTMSAGDLPLSRLLLMNDATYPWLILVPRRADLREIIDLDEAGQGLLTAEIAAASRALRAMTSCDKLNVAAIGNVVAQLHLHVVARFRTDPAWPRPVWGAGAPVPYAEGAMEDFVARLRAALPLVPSPPEPA